MLFKGMLNAYDCDSCDGTKSSSRTLIQHLVIEIHTNATRSI